MNQFWQDNYLDLWWLQIVVIDLVIAVAMIISLRFLSGLVANVKTGNELAVNDNAAFGLVIAGGAVALTIMLTGVLSGGVSDSRVEEILLVSAYGGLGLVLIKLGRVLQDKLLLPKVSVQNEIMKGNMSAAFVDVANTLAIALVLRAVMMWVPAESFSGLGLVLIGFVVAQLMLALVTRCRLAIYARRHDGACLQQAFEANNVALSVRYLGHVIGVALAMTAASGLVVANIGQMPKAIFLWVSLTLLLALITSLIALLARKMILIDIDVIDEVDKQKNVAVAAIEASIYISIGLILTALLG